MCQHPICARPSVQGSAERLLQQTQWLYTVKCVQLGVYSVYQLGVYSVYQLGVYSVYQQLGVYSVCQLGVYSVYQLGVYSVYQHFRGKV